MYSNSFLAATTKTSSRRLLKIGRLLETGVSKDRDFIRACTLLNLDPSILKPVLFILPLIYISQHFGFLKLKLVGLMLRIFFQNYQNCEIFLSKLL